MDALIVEMNLSSCYEMIEQYCCCVMEHLPNMQKERVCPEETVEAIATLIFAAARFPDLPELADLRNVFSKKYGTHMEAYINEEFVEKMKKKCFPHEKKLQLMQDIARECSILWDFKAFEYKLLNPSAPTLDQPKAENSKQRVVKKEEDLDTSYQVSDMQKKQLKSEELMNTENIKKYQNIVQMRRFHHHPHEKFNEVGADELEKDPLNANTDGRTTSKRFESVRLRLDSISIERQSAASMDSRDAEAVNRIPPYTQISNDFGVTGTNQADSSHSIVQGSQPDRTMNPGSNRAFNLKPPYVIPRVTRRPSLETGYAKPTNHEMSNNGGNYIMNPPFLIRRTSSYADSVAGDANLRRHIPTKQASSAGNQKSMDENFLFPLSKQIEEDARNGAIYRRRRLQRAFSDRPRHGNRLS